MLLTKLVPNRHRVGPLSRRDLLAGNCFSYVRRGGQACFGSTVNPKKLETGLRPNSAGIPYTLVLRIEAIGFPTFGLLL